MRFLIYRITNTINGLGKARMTPEARSRVAQVASKARFAKMTPEERSDLARKAIIARWSK